MRAHSTMSPDEYFWNRVDKSGDCWEWTSSRDRDGYGYLSFQNKKTRAHCHSFFLANGDIPDGLCVCHTCDNPACVRPDHLFLGTNLDNIRDRTVKGRSASGSKNGVHFRPKIYYAPGTTRLTEDQVREIRRLWDSKMESGDDIGARFGIARRTVYAIVHRRRWKHVA